MSMAPKQESAFYRHLDQLRSDRELRVAKILDLPGQPGVDRLLVMAAEADPQPAWLKQRIGGVWTVTWKNPAYDQLLLTNEDYIGADDASQWEHESFGEADERVASGEPGHRFIERARRRCPNGLFYEFLVSKHAIRDADGRAIAIPGRVLAYWVVPEPARGRKKERADGAAT